VDAAVTIGWKVGAYSVATQHAYIAPSTITGNTLDTVFYTISDQYNDAMAAGSASVQLDAGPSITSVTPSVVSAYGRLNEATMSGFFRACQPEPDLRTAIETAHVGDEGVH
jgi:hypothetical protein